MGNNVHAIVHNNQLINYYLEKSTDIEKVLNIFIRVNNGGTKLNYTDLLLSIAIAQWEKRDARQETNKFVDEINKIGNGFDFNKDVLLKACLVLSDFNNMVVLCSFCAIVSFAAVPLSLILVFLILFVFLLFFIVIRLNEFFF